jgi:ubiquinone/menaquinone biosynthesis C-methylase UbiE
MDLDVYGGSEKEVSLTEVKNFLRENFRKESERYFGLKDAKWIDRATDNWFDDQNNYDGRWKIIRERVPTVGKVLYMAAGCGTFVLFGLHNGYDAWGVEPEEWKREYFRKKILASNYPVKYLDHVVASVGEALPFQDESFDIVTTYQTLEHVRDVNMCILEMLRVLKPWGILYIKAPDYNCFFEPHYRVPFLPKMNKKLAAAYLRVINKPILGGLYHNIAN